MPYDPLTPAEIAAGKPTKEELFTKIKDNQEDFDTRITALQGTANFNIFSVSYTGDISSYELPTINERAPIFKSPKVGTVVSFTVTLLEVSTSGQLEILLEKSTDNGVNWTPMNSSPLTLTGLTVGTFESLDPGDWGDDTINQNDLLRITIDAYQVNQGDFQVSVYGESST